MSTILKYLSLGLFILTFTVNLQSQGLELTFGDYGFDSGSQLSKTSDNGYIITGAKTTSDSMGADVLLLKLDSNGVEEWSKTFGGAKSDGGTSILQTADNGYLIGAYSRSFSSNGSMDYWLIKTNSAGDILWENLLLIEPEDDVLAEIIEANDGGYIVLGTTANIEPTWNKAKLIKIDGLGNVLWEQIYQAPNYHTSATDIVALADGSGYAFCGSQDYKAFLTKVDNFGNVIFNEEYTFPNNDIIRAYTLEQTDDGGFLFTIDADFWTNVGDQKIFVVKTDSNGVVEWSDDYGGDGDEYARSITKSANGNYCILGYSTSVGNNYLQVWMMEIDIDGNVIWERHHGGIQRELAYHIEVADDNGFLVVGLTRSYGAGSDDVYFLKTDSLGHIFSNYVEGNVYEDLNQDCLYDPNDVVMPKWLVRIAGDKIYETLTDDNGHYKQNVAPGDYTITIHPPNNYWEPVCFDSTEYSFVNPYEFLNLDIPVTERVDCSYLEVDIATSFLRICSSPRYYVNYCNTGSSIAENAYIEVSIDEYISVDSASIPIASQVGDLYTFDIGDVDQSECGDFIIYTKVDCDTSIIGYTHCVEANIFPDSLCIHPDSLIWGGASLSLSGNCDTDSIYFFIENVGTGATSNAIEYIVIEDDVMYDMGQLNPLEISASHEIAVPANGSTFRLEVEQENGHPGNSMPSIIIQNCGVDSLGTSSSGFVNIFAFNEGNASTSIFCSQNIYPFDPNDKQGFPNGYREDHMIEKNQDIEYLVRFQNTGTAEAFAVSIVDTLSPFLDITSVRPGVASHDYDYEVLNGNVVRFTFNDINLPDSTTNFEESQGFVQFQVSQKDDIAIGDVIYNSADIYFDFASPVKTNETWHTIGENFIEIILKNEEVYTPNLNVNAFPNPFREKTTIQLEGVQLDRYRLLLYNVQGQFIREEIFENNALEMERKGLGVGVYFYNIISSKGVAATGKMIVQ